MAKKKMLKVTQIGSPIRRPADQLATLKGLGGIPANAQRVPEDQREDEER